MKELKIIAILIVVILSFFGCESKTKISDNFIVTWSESCNCHAIRQKWKGNYTVTFIENVSCVFGNSNYFVVETTSTISKVKNYSYINDTMVYKEELILLDRTDLELLVDTMTINFTKSFEI